MTRWRRGFTVVGRLLPFVLAFVRDRRRWLLFGAPARRTPEQHRERAARLTRVIAELGPTFIKLAQVFSARADILPEPYLGSVGSLHDQVPPDPFEDICRVIEAELGRPVGEVFTDLEAEPVAAASLGQVHRARLGEDVVAIKVLRPGVEELVALDLDVSFRVLLLLNVLFPNHHVRALTNVVREFSVRVREEMDFREEARHVEQFRRQFGDDARVRAPYIHEALTRRRVLVMEWVNGDKVDRLAHRFESGQLDFGEMMEALTEIYLRMLMVEGFVHADPHPGNILVEEDGTIVLLDWGMAFQLARSTREGILRVALAAGRDDIDAMISGMYELGMIDPAISRAEIRDAAAEILVVVARVRELGAKRVQEIIRDIMDTFYTWPLMLPRELVYFFRASALLEGIGFRYDPAFNGIETVRPVILRMKTTLLQATAREPVEFARSIVDDARAGLSAVRQLITRAEREEFRVRIHPRDLLQTERFAALQVRRILLSIFALTIALITAITFISVRSVWLLAGGLGVALVMFLVVLFLPTHLLENPMRHARGLGREHRQSNR
ncbi:MAG: AarF/ABC1/UbiB kinase family protein [Gemmatimonadetes bacterium]|nr:AarF/ABC1/UbiB kinase family protein [Gemmatimonadota bacterium]